MKEGLRLTIGLRAQPQQQAPASGKPQILSHRLGVVGATGSASALGLQKGVTDAQTGWQDPALLQSQWRAGVPWASLTVHCSPWATHGPLLPGLWGPSGCRKGQKRELQQQPCHKFSFEPQPLGILETQWEEDLPELVFLEAWNLILLVYYYC